MNKTTAALKLAEEALNAMLTHMGMDEDEWTKPTFNQAREAEAALREALAQPQENTARCGGCNKTVKDGWALYCVECWEKAQPQGEPVAFEEWYEANVKYIKTADFKPWMSEAWDAAIEATKEKMKKVFAVATPKSTWTTDRIIAEIEDMK